MIWVTICASHLGKAVVAWENPAAMMSFEFGTDVPPELGIVLLQDGPAIVAARAAGVPGQRRAWNLSTGKTVAPEQGFCVDHWLLGVTGIEGKFVVLLK